MKKFVMSEDVACSKIDQGMALLNMKSNVYFTLNGTGTLIWDCIDQPKSIEEIASVVSEAYNVTKSDCFADVEALVNSLVLKGLVRVDDAHAI